jgi:hypothetical protein
VGKIIEFDWDLGSTELLKKYGIAMPNGFVDSTPEGQEKRRRSCPASSMSSSGRSTPVVVPRAGSPERPTRDDADLANKEIDDERDAIAVAAVLAPGVGT